MPEHPDPKIVPKTPAPPVRVADCLEAYAELDVTSNFSFLQGASHPSEMVYRAAELGYRAIAITDRHTLAGAVRAHVAARQCGMKLIVGARVPLVDGPELLLWAANRKGYANLCKLLTIGKRRTVKGECILGVEDVAELAAGLIGGILFNTKTQRHEEVNESNRNIFSINEVSNLGDFVFLSEAFSQRLYLTFSRHYSNTDHSYLDHMRELSRATKIPLVATNQAHYHDPSRRQLQDVLTCVQHGCTIAEAGFRLYGNCERYLKPPDVMHRLFSEFPDAIANTVRIAEQCNFSMDELKYEYPDEIAPPGMNMLEYLTKLTWEGAAERYPNGLPEKVRKQIEHELVLIEELHFAAYFLTVYDIVKFARSRDILCQGRGSAANSAVCYCIGVTSVDPSKIDLLFERFVSRARHEPPDIDIDFEHERREEVLQYIYEKYGRDRAGLAAEIISYRGRSAVRDVGKAMGLSLDMVDSMAKRLDGWSRGTLNEEQIRQAGVDPSDPTVRKTIEITSQLLGFPRHLGQHVGGMVISRGPLCELVPIENAAMENRTVVEWDKDDLEDLGLLKVDCLGLGMLSCLAKGLKLINCNRGQFPKLPYDGAPAHLHKYSPSIQESEHGPEPRDTKNFTPPIELHTIPADDPAVYDMICNADTVGVFQIESRAQMSMLPRLRPRNFYDLVIEVAIVRPGPIQGNMVHPYLRRRNGEETVSYPSEALRQVLHKTLGVPLFQEQAMKIAMVAAGFTAEEADQLRRAMAAWKKSTALLGFRDKIINGMLKNGYTQQFAEQCFEQIKGFGEYGFPESHSASFALLVYASAWMKCHHPAVFATALINSQPMGFYAPAQIVRDAKDHGVEVRGVDVNHSQWDCLLETRDEETERQSEISSPSSTASLRHSVSMSLPPAMRLGFRLVKGLRKADVDHFVSIRQKVGRFTSIEQFHQSTGLSKKTLKILAEADAFGSLGLTRRHALWEVMGEDIEKNDEDTNLQFTAKPQADQVRELCPENACGLAVETDDLFSPSVNLPSMSLGQEVMTDYTTTGLSLKSHPCGVIRDQLSARKILSTQNATTSTAGKWVRTAGLILVRQRPGTAAGIVFVTLEDETGIANLIIRPEVYERFRPIVRFAGLMQVEGTVERQGKVVHIMVKRAIDLSYMLAGYSLTSRDFH